MAGLLAPSLLALYSPAPHFSRALLGAEVVPKGVTGLGRQPLPFFFADAFPPLPPRTLDRHRRHALQRSAHSSRIEAERSRD